ncbi:hypothetical protein BV363_03007 [Pseudomonas syringae pv. actinidiae]|uniref:Uncharacterized protein n=2 Tax=Pseudomonas syringae pv. actinidiae TaxID=103796 RepID=A0A2P0QEY6_PSESF|nr:hypothetical protein [Pseudomonas syringae pv. actinidiae]OSO51452.1 hypothetical protein BV363_03007 [Pseudomonas syringae pv. actinidiae]
MARSTRMMFPGIAFCLVALAANGWPLVFAAITGLGFIGMGCIFWVYDGE